MSVYYRLSLTMVIVCAVQTMAAGQEPYQGIIGLRADMNLVQKIGIIQRHMEANHYGNRTIPLSMTYDGGIDDVVRHWETADIRNQSLPAFRSNVKGQPPKVSGIDWLNNENSSYFSGGYLLSQVYRYQFTHDKAALDECRRALKGIQAIAALAEPERFGWICKPYGERLQDFSSPDQNIYIVEGLWAFLPDADAEQAAWIKRVIPAMASYWERVHYTILSFTDVWDMHKDATFMRMFKVINLVAFKITNRKEFLDVANRIEAEFGEMSVQSVSLFDTREAASPGCFEDWKRVAEYSVNIFAPIQLDILGELRPEKKKEWLAIWERVLKYSLIGYDKSYGGHYYYTEVKKIDGEYAWRPLQTVWPTYTHEELVNPDKFAFGRYPHRIYWLDATSRIPLIYLMYLKNGGARIAYMEEIVRDIMQKLDFDHLHWMVDPHHDQTIPELDYTLHALTSESANYVAAWWLGRKLGFWKE